MEQDPRVALKSALDDQDLSTASLHALRAALSWSLAVLRDHPAANRGQALKSIIELDAALDAGAGLGEAVSALVKHAQVPEPLREKLEAQGASLRRVADEVATLRDRIGEHEAMEAKLEAHRAEAARLTEQLVELERIGRVVDDSGLAELRAQVRALEERLGPMKAAALGEETALASAAGNLVALTAGRLNSLRLETQRALEEAAAQQSSWLDQSRKAREDIERAHADLESVRSKVQEARRQYEVLRKQCDADVVELRLYIEANAEVVQAFTVKGPVRDTEVHRLADESQAALDEVRSQLTRIDSGLARALKRYEEIQKSEHSLQRIGSTPDPHGPLTARPLPFP